MVTIIIDILNVAAILLYVFPSKDMKLGFSSKEKRLAVLEDKFLRKIFGFKKEKLQEEGKVTTKFIIKYTVPKK
jgi:hypothetical protein